MAKIMVVEDDNNLSEIYQARLTAEGYQVSVANNGEEALALAAKEKPDLIISDVMMPKISGFEMLDILRNTQGLNDTKVIVLTALGQAEDKTRAESLRADLYLVKSQVTLEDIVKSVKDLLSPDGVGVQPAIPAPVPSETPASANTPAPDVTATSPIETPAPETPTIPVASPAPAEPVVTTSPMTPPPATPAPQTVTPGVTPASPETPTSPSNDSAPVAHKKIIQPFENSSKPDINQLFAAEEAKVEPTTTTPAQPGQTASSIPQNPEEHKPGSVFGPQPTGGSTDQNNTGIDTSNISL